MHDPDPPLRDASLAVAGHWTAALLVDELRVTLTGGVARPDYAFCSASGSAVLV